MRGFVFSIIAVTTLFVGSAGFAAQSSGQVGSFDRHERTFWINGQKYQLPETSRKHPVNGDTVSVRYDQQAGVRMVSFFTIDKTSSDD